MLILKTLYFFFMAFLVIISVYNVSADDSLQILQKRCKSQNEAFRDKEMSGSDSCPEYKNLVYCIAEVNFKSVNSFVNEHKPEGCEFTDKEIRDLQKYKMAAPTTVQTMITTTEVNKSAGQTLMKFLLVVTLLLQVVFL